MITIYLFILQNKSEIFYIIITTHATWNILYYLIILNVKFTLLPSLY